MFGWLTQAHALTQEIPDLNESLQPFMDSGDLAGFVVIVGDHSELRHGETGMRGFANLETRTPMEEDTLFWIASMTKPITATAVMMLAEEGKLSVDDSVAKYLPEFKGLKDADGKEVTITIANCLSHTSGLQEMTAQEDMATTNLEELAHTVVAKPVKFTPGSKWVYCQSGMSIAARIVEVVSGDSFPEFLQKRLFDPLSMKDTTFYPNEEQMKRMAVAYEKKDGKLSPVAPYFLNGRPATDKSRYPRASGGLFSTGADYAQFAQMLLSVAMTGEKFRGHHYLKQETLREMTRARTQGLDFAFVPGTFYGLGCGVIQIPGGSTEALSIGSFGHGGAYGTQAWIDPVRGRFSILMVQRANYGSGDASELRKVFQNASAR